MKIENTQDGKINLEVNENEFILLQSLLEKSKNQMKGKVENSLSEKMFNEMATFDL